LTQKLQILDLLDRALNGLATLDEAFLVQKKIEPVTTERELRILHQIIHFLTDIDLHSKDESYRVLMVEKLKSMADEL
jgi:hypothetical protein